MYSVKCKIFKDQQSLKYLNTHNELNIRQRGWLELLTNYDLDITYYEGKVNLVVDALCRKSTHSVNALRGFDKLIKDFAKLNLEIICEGELQKVEHSLYSAFIFFFF